MYNKHLPNQYYRSENNLRPPKPLFKPTLALCTQSKPAPPPKKKFDFKTLKNNTCSSLNDVECFLNNFCTTLKYIKLINLLK